MDGIPMTKEMVALIGAVIAGLISLIVAALNFIASSRLKRMSRQYDLLKLDLEHLDKVQDEIGFLVMPKLPDLSEIETLPSATQTEIWQGVFDELNPVYMRACTIMLRHRVVFSDEIQKELEERINIIDRASGVAGIAHRLDFMSWSVNAVQDRISTLRAEWKQ